MQCQTYPSIARPAANCYSSIMAYALGEMENA